ncbi:MAG: D-glycero-beta-D-manno-heptose 1-phosphate adenylyltransferase [Fimbriimonadaceae bacterium]|nr:D-glycero-beta-D-manno-heptose 1-phosphate adenylyltransferase [Fimbriimonadaceae bacterium]
MSLLTPEQAVALRQGKKLVFTNGVFDILHAGHVQYLKQARALGDLLIVGMNSDASTRTLAKAPDRPINTLEDRAAVLSELRCVDGVVSFEESTPEQLIELLKPEVHVKGGDYRIEDLPEAKIVHAYGGEVVILPFLSGHSTTETLKRLRGE